MKYHRKLLRAQLERLPWSTVVGMVASELSRAEHLRGAGGETESCILRAKELLGVLESAPAIPVKAGIKLLSVIKNFAGGIPSRGFKGFYDECMDLSEA